MKTLLLAFILLSSLGKAQTTGCNQSSFNPVTICYPNQTKVIGQTVQTDLIYLCGTNSVVWDTLNPSSIKYRVVFVNTGGVYNYKSTLSNNQVTIYAKSGSTVNVLPGTNLAVMFSITKEAGTVFNNSGTGSVTANNTCSVITGPSINCISTGINEVRSVTIENTVWPNPSSGKLYINARADEKTPVMLNVINQLGEVVFAETYFNTGKKEIDLEKYSAGIYFVRIKSGDVTETKKIVLLQ
jgi:hypothetical protein